MQWKPNVSELTEAAAKCDPRRHNWQGDEPAHARDLHGRIMRSKNLQARIHERERADRDHHRGGTSHVVLSPCERHAREPRTPTGHGSYRNSVPSGIETQSPRITSAALTRVAR